MTVLRFADILSRIYPALQQQVPDSNTICWTWWD